MASHITMAALSFVVAWAILQTFCHAVPLHSGEMGFNRRDGNHTGIEGRNGSEWGDRRPGRHGSMARRLRIVLEILRLQQGPSRMDNDTMPGHNKTRDMDGNSTCEEWRHELMHRLGRLAKHQLHARDEEHKRPSNSHNRTRPNDAKPDRDEMPSPCRQSRELLRLLRHAVLGKNCLPRGEHNGSFERDNMTGGAWNHTRGPKDDDVNATGQHGAGSRGARKWEQEVFRVLVDLAMREPGHQRMRDDDDNESDRLNGTRPEARNCTDDDDDEDDVNDDNERLDRSRPEWRERLVRILRRLASRGRRGGEGSRRANGDRGEEAEGANGELRGERTEHSNERQRQVGGRRGEGTRPGGESSDERERPAGGRRGKRHAGGPRGDRTRPTGEPSNERTRPTGERTRPTGEPRDRSGEGRRRGPEGENGDERPRPAGGQRGDRTRPTGEPSNERTRPTGERTRPTGEPRDGLGEGRQRGSGERRGGNRRGGGGGDRRGDKQQQQQQQQQQ